MCGNRGRGERPAAGAAQPVLLRATVNSASGGAPGRQISRSVRARGSLAESRVDELGGARCPHTWRAVPVLAEVGWFPMAVGRPQRG